MPNINAERIVRNIVVVGASAGGIPALQSLLACLRKPFPAALGVVIHRSPTPPTSWAAMLGKFSKLQVIEPVNGERLVEGCAYVAPADHHMTFHKGFAFLNRGRKQHHTRPALDPLFESAASDYGNNVVGAVLTGGGSDGAEGLRCIWQHGGLCFVQADAEHPWMPENARAHDHVSASLDIPELADALTKLAVGLELERPDAAKPYSAASGPQ